MTRMRETFATLWQSARYSLAFCWRNDKGNTLARFGVTAVTTVMLYGGIQATGLIANAVQQWFTHPQDASVRLLLWPLAFFSALLFAGDLLGRANWYTRARWSQGLWHANQRELQCHRASLDVARSRSKQYDDLEKRINELPHGQRTRVAFTEDMISLFAVLVSFVLFGATLLWYKPAYAAILAAATLPVFLVEFREGFWWWSLYERMVPIHKRRFVLERAFKDKTAFLQGLMFNQLPFLRPLIDEKFDEVFNEYEALRKRAVRYEMAAHLLATIGLCGVVAHAVWSTVSTVGEIGTLLVVIAAARTFKGNLEEIAAYASQQWNCAKGIILIEKDYFGLKPVIQTVDPIVPTFSGPPCIRFDRVSFTYPDTEPEVLHEVSFTIEPGAKVALVGRNGQGKTTIQALLMRIFEPTSGAIYTDDINLRNIEPSEWCKYVSALTQKYDILDRTVGEEIASSRMDEPTDSDRLMEASRFACFDEVVEADPLGFDSQIGIEFGGREFSGGEEQRLALARVRYRNTPILILDEPDASLDPETAQKVMDRVFALERVTVILITQHVSRTERCDKVVVVNQGRVVEQGQPAELMTQNGHYASLFRVDKRRLVGTEVDQIGQ